MMGTAYRCIRPRFSPFDRVRSNSAACRGQIEVERKVMVDSTFKQRIRKAGGTPQGTTRIVDTYYDTWCFQLVFGDAWLRRRNVDGQVRWEFKVGPGISHGGHTAASYTEYVGKDAAVKVHDFIKAPFSDLSDLLKMGKLQALVRVATTRESFLLKGHVIDIDTTDEGHIVAEVERVVDREEDVEAARQGIDALCESLDIARDAPPAPGKMESALKTQQKDLLIRLQGMREAPL